MSDDITTNTGSKIPENENRTHLIDMVAASAVVGATAATTGALHRVIVESPEKNGVVQSLQTPTGRTSIYYDEHVNPVPINEFPQDSTGIWLECYDWYKMLMDNGSNDSLTQKAASLIQENRSYLLKELLKNGKPFYFGDVNYKHPDLATAAYIAPLAIESTAGILMTIGASENIRSGLRTTRRNLLQMGLGTFLSLPAIAAAGRFLTASQPTADIEQSASILHPELSICQETVREALIIQKQQYMQKLRGQNSHDVIVFGAAHSGLETQLRSTEKDRLQYIRNTRPLWSQFMQDEGFDKVLEIRPVHGKNPVMTLHTVPELTEILQS